MEQLGGEPFGWPFAPGSQAAPQHSVHGLLGESDLPTALSSVNAGEISTFSLEGSSKEHTRLMVSGAAGTEVFLLPFAQGSQVAPNP